MKFEGNQTYLCGPCYSAVTSSIYGRDNKKPENKGETAGDITIGVEPNKTIPLKLETIIALKRWLYHGEKIRLRELLD